MKLEDLKRDIYSILKPEQPVIAAMFIKNWKRYKACIEYLSENIEINRDIRILDFGCGHPLVAKLLVELGYNVVPFEPYAGESELKTAQLLGLADQYKTDLDPIEKFDVVLMIDVIEHLSIIKPIMQNVCDLMDDNGCLLISTPNVMRVEMWFAFIMRKTGHPQDLNHFLESDNNYTHHQREFTMSELKATMKHFGLKVTDSTCVNTRPSIEDMNQLRVAKGQPSKSKAGVIKLMRELVFRILRLMFSKKFDNNLLLIARK